METAPPAVTIPEDQRWAECHRRNDFSGERVVSTPTTLHRAATWSADYHPTHKSVVVRLVTADEWDAICAERARLEEELVGLARLALHTTRRDVELFVHRLAYRHRSTPLGDALAAQDVVPAVSLRTVAADEARLAKLDRIEAAWRRYMAEPDLDDMSDVDRLIEVLVLTLDGEL